MSLIWLCISCGGTYADTLPDGGLYRHVCPREIRGAGGKFIPTPNPRNETVLLNRLNVVTGIQAEGHGVECVTDKRQTEPRWITEMKDRIAKQEALDDY